MGTIMKMGTQYPSGTCVGANDLIGSMTIYAGSNLPPGYLLCDGSAISRTTYKELFDVIGTTWGAGDGSTTFNVPDLREVTPVGIGQSERTEDSHDVFTLGEFKDDQLQDHTQSVATSGGNHNHYSDSLVTGEQMTNAYQPNTNTVLAVGKKNGYVGYSGNLSMSGSATTITDGRHGDVTRGKRIGVNYIIKAKQVLMCIDVRDELNDIENDIDEINNDLSYDLIASGTSPEANKTIPSIANKREICIVATTTYGYKFSSVFPKTEFNTVGDKIEIETGGTFAFVVDYVDDTHITIESNSFASYRVYAR